MRVDVHFLNDGRRDVEKLDAELHCQRPNNRFAAVCGLDPYSRAPHWIVRCVLSPKAPERPRDLNQWAKCTVDIATGEVSDREPTPEEQGNAQNIH